MLGAIKSLRACMSGSGCKAVKACGMVKATMHEYFHSSPCLDVGDGGSTSQAVKVFKALGALHEGLERAGYLCFVKCHHRKRIPRFLTHPANLPWLRGRIN